MLVLTQDALASPWVESDMNAAIRLARQGAIKNILPIQAGPVDYRTLPPLLGNYNIFDATRDYPAARDALLRTLGLSAPSPAAAAPIISPPSSVGARPVSPAVSPAPAANPAMLPSRLAQLGFAAYRNGSTDYIVPPAVTVPVGQFLIGSDRAKDKRLLDDEQPQRRVNLSAFQIAKFPLTVAEYACFVRSGHADPEHWEYQGKVVDWRTQFQRLNHPVVMVSWNDVVAYANWLAKQTGQPWRLPTEAEWEKAARGTEGRIYPWGDAFDGSRGNTSEGGKGTTTPVGSYSSGASPCGALDMAGNVWEWTSSLFKPYPYIPTDGRENVNSTDSRVLRGARGTAIPGTCARPAASTTSQTSPTTSSARVWRGRSPTHKRGRRPRSRLNGVPPGSPPKADSELAAAKFGVYAPTHR